MAQTPEVIDVGTRSAEEIAIQTDGESLVGFLNRLGSFFLQARAREDEAKRTLEVSKTWQQPKTLEEDEIIVAEVRKASADKRTINDLWEPCGLLHRLHRATTAARDRGVKMLDSAIARGNMLHGAYEQAEQNRIREEARRQREEAEREAQEKRDAELAEIERKTREAEESSPELSKREDIFVGLVLNGHTPKQAARMAGFKDFSIGDKMMERPKIAAAIEAARTAMALKRQAEAVAAAPLRTTMSAQPIPAAQVATKSVGRKSCEVYDEAVFIANVLDSASRLRLHIPPDVVTINQTKLNELARDIPDVVASWPGCRVVEKRGIR